jgi:hypothetical protein
LFDDPGLVVFSFDEDRAVRNAASEDGDERGFRGFDAMGCAQVVEQGGGLLDVELIRCHEKREDMKHKT